jgi:geranylgeranyl diphosphate synthase, type I
VSSDRERLDRAIAAACSVDPANGVSDGVGLAAATEIVRLQLQTGGKRLRGLLPVAVVTRESGDVQAALRFGAAIEAIHNGTLVHDDIQDKDTLRRGKPTLWTQTGIPQAINAGDVLLVAPITAILADSALSDSLSRSLASLLAGALLETIRGQVADVGLRDAGAVTREQLSGIACAKTSPLFACALQGAGMILGASEQRLQAARVCGHRLGLAFQIRDDLLDAVGTKGRGNAGADLREGKPTWPLLAACTGAPEAEVAELRALLRGVAAGITPTSDQVQKWVNWTHARGGVEMARAALAEALDDARQHANAAFPQAGEVVGKLCDRLAKLDG